MAVWDQKIVSDIMQLDEFRRSKQPVAEAYLKVRTRLRDVKAAMRLAPNDASLHKLAAELQNQLQVMEQEEPWLIAEVPVEVALWGSNSGLL